MAKNELKKFYPNFQLDLKYSTFTPSLKTNKIFIRSEIPFIHNNYPCSYESTKIQQIYLHPNQQLNHQYINYNQNINRSMNCIHPPPFLVHQYLNTSLPNYNHKLSPNLSYKNFDQYTKGYFNNNSPRRSLFKQVSKYNSNKNFDKLSC